MRSAEILRDALLYRTSLAEIAANVDRQAQHTRAVATLRAELATLEQQTREALDIYRTKWADDAKRVFEDVHRRWIGKENELKALQSAGA